LLCRKSRSRNRVGSRRDRGWLWGSLDWGQKGPSLSDRCLNRLRLATAISAINRTLRNSEGTSIIVGRLDRAKAEDKEGYRRKSAPGAVSSENFHSLNLHALQPSGLEF
jgi:hypothetical protein